MHTGHPGGLLLALRNMRCINLTSALFGEH